MSEPQGIPVEEFLAQDRLMRADVVLCRGKKLSSKLIRWWTRSEFSHAALVFVIPNRDQGFNNTFLIESVSGGVDITDLKHYVEEQSKKYDVAVKRLDEEWFTGGENGSALQRLVRGCMLDFIKAEYDYGTIWYIVRTLISRFLFGVQQRFRGLEKTLDTAFEREWQVPSQFICSGFVQYGFYEAVRRQIKQGELPAGRLAQVLFRKDPPAQVTDRTLLAATPEDLARAPQLAWKYVIVDQQAYEVATEAEAYARLGTERAA